MSLSVWACLQKQGNHKTMKCFFSFPLTHFSFGGAFLAHWAGGSGSNRRRLMERATWTNPVWNQAARTARTARPSQIYDSHPTFPTQRPLSGASGCVGPCLLLFVTSVCLSFLSRFPISLFFLCPSIFSLPLFLYLLPFSSSLFPRHPGQLFIQAGCLQLSVWSCVGCIACGVELFPNTSVSSLRSIHNLSMTLTPQLHVFFQNHTLHRGNLGEVTLQKMYT